MSFESIVLAFFVAYWVGAAVTAVVVGRMCWLDKKMDFDLACCVVWVASVFWCLWLPAWLIERAWHAIKWRQQRKQRAWVQQ